MPSAVATAPSSTASSPSRLGAILGRSGVSARRWSRTGFSSRSTLWPTPPPSTTRSGSSTAAAAATVCAIRSPSSRTALTAASSPRRAASNTAFAVSCPLIPNRRAASTTATPDTASSSRSGFCCPGHGRNPISPASPCAPVKSRPSLTTPMPRPVPIRMYANSLLPAPTP